MNRAAASAVSVEPLESRQYLALFLNGIDSENLGKGMWAWTIQGSSGGMQRDGFSDTNYTGWMNYLKNTQHLDYVIIKAGSGNSQLSQYNTSLVNAAHAAGIKIFPYFYIYGDVPDGGGTHSSTAEASVFNSVFGSSGPGGDGAIFDIESEYGDNDSAGINNYFNLIGKSQSGNGSGSRDRLFMAYSTFDILHFHYTQFPCSTIADYCDAAMPQMYWKAHGYSIAFDLQQVDADFKNTTYVGVNGVKPVIPTGQTYDSGNGNPTGAETDQWLAAIKADTSAVGGTGAPAGWRYKSVNYFDERTLDRDVNGNLLPTAPAQRNAVAAEDIGDLPGTPVAVSPANGATNQPGTGLVLDWADVVNTFGNGSVGAATSYDVYLDNMSTPVTTINYTAPNKPLSQYAVPGTLATGSHTWKIVAKNMFGSTSSPVWNFAVGLIAPTIPTNPVPADNAALSASPTLLDWDSNFASSYDVTLDGVFQANVTNSQYTIGTTLAQGTHTWQITAKNSAGNTPGPTWTFLIVPKVSNVTSTATNGTYTTGATIPVSVVFNAAVNVTGTPLLALNSGGTASYASGSGTNTLVFNYTVGAGQNATDLDYSSTGALTLNGGTIKDVASGNDVALTLPATGGVGSLGANKNIVVDTTGPTVTNVTSSTTNGTYASGSISIQIAFNENVFVTGTPLLALNSGGTASYASGSGTSTLTFTYTIAGGQNSADLDEASASALSLNGGTMKDAIGNSAVMTVPAPGSTGSLGANKAIVVDTAAPTVSNVTSSTANGIYSSGAVISIQVVFNETAIVTGTPKLALNTGVSANYSSGSGTNTLTFTYTVASGQTSSDLDYTSTAALTLNGGTIKDGAANNATLTLASPGAAGSLGFNKNIVVDSAVPSVTNVTATTADGVYSNGAVLITVTFTANVTVTGTPRIVLNTGGNASFISGNGSSVLTFRYPIGLSENTADLDYVSTSSLTLSGGTIKSAGGANASLVLPAPGGPGSLGFNKNITIDSLAPTATVTQALGQADPGRVAPVHFTVTFSEQVIDFDAGDLSFGGTANPQSVVVTSTGTTTYDIAISGMTQNGTVTFGIGDSACSDVAGNVLGDVLITDDVVTYDTTPPTATYGGQTPGDGDAYLDFTVTYADGVGVDTTTFDGNDILMVGPGGYSEDAPVISIVGNVVTYRFNAPGGIFDSSDNGTYTIMQNPGEVSDIAGNSRPEGAIGSFAINLPVHWAWKTGTTLNVQFDGSSTPIALGTSGANITATRGTETLTFANIDAITVLGSPNDDSLELDGSVTPALSFSNGNGHDSMEVMGGTYTFASDLAPALANIDVIVDPGAGAIFNSSQHLGALTANGTVAVTPGGAKVLVLTDLSIGAAGKLDLADNDLVVNYGLTSPLGSLTGGVYDGIAGLIATGRNGGSWDGLGGIVSSSATSINALGVGEASAILGPSGGMFSGESVDGSAVLVKFTYGGDATLDGKVNIDDYTKIDSGIAAGINMWVNGDFNFDGKINIDDYVLIDGIVSLQGGVVL